MSEIGHAGQKKLKAASVLIIGAGGLGSPLSMYLAAAGIGRLGIIDFDRVDLSNLHRQILFSDADVGRPKVEAAKDRLFEINPLIEIECHDIMLSKDNAIDLIGQYDIVADGSDNFATRYLVNDACVLTGTPNVYGSVSQFSGQVAIFGASDGPCYRCLYPEPPPPGLVLSCAEGGVLGVLPGIIGSLQAVEVVKFITGIGSALIGRLLLYDALAVEFKQLSLDADPDCPVCGENRTITKLIDYDAFCGNPVKSVDKNSDLVQNNMNPLYPTCSPAELKKMMDERDDVVLIDVRTPPEYEIENLGGQLLPLMDLPDRLSELDDHKNKDVVVMCRSGVRSAQAQAYLIQNGFASVTNLAGGILAWKSDLG